MLSTWQEVCKTTGAQTESMEGSNRPNSSGNVLQLPVSLFGEFFSFSVLVIHYLWDSNMYSCFVNLTTDICTPIETSKITHCNLSPF